MNTPHCVNLFVLTRVRACDINKHAEFELELCFQQESLRLSSASPRVPPFRVRLSFPTRPVCLGKTGQRRELRATLNQTANKEL
jgi:hypothetical protein